MAETPQFEGVEYPSEEWLKKLHQWFIVHGAEHSPATIDDIWKIMMCVIYPNSGLFAGEYCNGLEYAGSGDLTKDGNVNMLDVIAIISCVLENSCHGLAEDYQWLMIDHTLIGHQGHPFQDVPKGV